MSISVDKLSLLGSLVPLRQKSDSSGIRQDNGFAERLDKALGSPETPAPSASGKARELAESLTLQMLQSSLALAGDSSSDGAAPTGPTVFTSANALLQAYRANLSADEGTSSGATVTTPSQLQELTDGLPACCISCSAHSQSKFGCVLA